MIFADKKELERLRRDYPAGCRLVLDEMNDPYRKMPAGLQGTCRGVDDAGNVLVSWDNGSCLNVAYGADRCHRVAAESEAKVTVELIGRKRHRGARCPRCGRKAAPDNRLLALSRRADITVCESCGTWEALEDAGVAERKELMEWAAMKESWWLE